MLLQLVKFTLTKYIHLLKMLKQNMISKISLGERVTKNFCIDIRGEMFHANLIRWHSVYNNKYQMVI